jgi:acetylornithine deacetylase
MHHAVVAIRAQNLRPASWIPMIVFMTMQLPPLETMIAQLIASPSVSSVQPDLDQSNREVCELLADWAESLGFEATLMPVPGNNGKYNLIARLGSGPGGMVLSGHSDTVPWDDGKWSLDPFKAERRDGRIYGLGTADMKSFLAIALQAAASIDRGSLRSPVTILATADEESTMSGARALVESETHLGRVAIIGEPTDLRPINLHKGILMEGIRLIGSSGHSSNPALGRNALDGMMEVVEALKELRREFAERFRDPGFEVPEPTLNLGYIRGGDNANRICGECEMHIDVRLNPGMTVASCRSAIRERIRERLAGSGLEVRFDALFEGVDPMTCDHRGQLVETCETETGHDRGAVCFGTEGPFLQALGLETVILGPGSIDQAHQPDEFLDLASAEQAVDLVGRLIDKYCVRQPEATSE